MAVPEGGGFGNVTFLREKQFNRQVELNGELRRLQQELKGI